MEIFITAALVQFGGSCDSESLSLFNAYAGGRSGSRPFSEATKLMENVDAPEM